MFAGHLYSLTICVVTRVVVQLLLDFGSPMKPGAIPLEPYLGGRAKTRLSNAPAETRMHHRSFVKPAISCGCSEDVMDACPRR